jgi:hypothetical protein
MYVLRRNNNVAPIQQENHLKKKKLKLNLSENIHGNIIQMPIDFPF